MRPLYESEHDRMNEGSVSDILSSAWNCRFVKLPMSYHVDWALMRGNEIVAFAELKTRKVPSAQYPTLILSLNKWIKGLDLAASTKTSFIIIAKWTDGIFYFVAKQDGVTFGHGGRTDRNDSQDVEPVAFIDIKNFTKVKERS